MSVIIRYTAIYISIFIFIPVCFTECDKGNLPPSARLVAFPPVADTTILFVFNASASEDDRDYAIGLMYRWDIDGNGTWDTGFAHSKTISHKYGKPGTYVVAVEVQDLDGLTSIARDSVTVFGENRDIDTLTDSRDGHRYRIVKILDRWWMAENLRFGVEIPTSREQSDNDTVEYYRYHYATRLDTAGGVYSWLEALNYRVKVQKGICPDGWHLPTSAEWESLFSPYPVLYSVQFYGRNGLSRLNLDLNNGASVIDHSFIWQTDVMRGSGFWSSSSKVKESEYLPYFVEFSSRSKDIFRGFWGDHGLDWRYSVRCIKDN